MNTNSSNAADIIQVTFTGFSFEISIRKCILYLLFFTHENMSDTFTPTSSHISQ